MQISSKPPQKWFCGLFWGGKLSNKSGSGYLWSGHRAEILWPLKAFNHIGRIINLGGIDLGFGVSPHRIACAALFWQLPAKGLLKGICLLFLSRKTLRFFFVELETILNQGKGGIWRQPEIKMALAPATFVVSGKSWKRRVIMRLLFFCGGENPAFTASGRKIECALQLEIYNSQCN